MFSPWTVMLLSCDWACAPYALWAFADIYTGLFWDSCWITCRAQRCGLPEALHGCWLKENKCFVLGISSSFQEVELSLNIRGTRESRVCSHDTGMSSVGTWVPVNKCNFLCMPVHLLAGHCTPSSLSCHLVTAHNFQMKWKDDVALQRLLCQQDNTVQGSWCRASK